MTDTSYHPDVVSLDKRKPVYINDLEIGRASNWREVATAVNKFAQALFGARHNDGSQFNRQLESVRELERLVGRSLHLVSHEFHEGPTAFYLKF